MIKYPILTSALIPQPAFTITPVTDSTITIDGLPVVTQFVWKSNSDPSSTGTVMGNSASTIANNLPVVILSPDVATYILNAGQASATSD